MERESCVFYYSFFEIIQEMPEEVQARAYNAIFRYAFLGEEPNATGLEKIAFLVAKPQIDANNKRYHAARCGGRPQKEDSQNQTETKVKPNENQTETKVKPNENQTETKVKPNENQTETKVKPNVNVNVNENVNANDNVNDNENVNTTEEPPYNPPLGGSARGLQEKRFDEFWAAYPKKQGKGAAQKAWMRVSPDTETHEKILDAVESNIRGNPQWRKDGGQFVPNPATWINQRRWEDGRPWEDGDPTAGAAGVDGSARARPKTWAEINASQQSQMEYLLEQIGGSWDGVFGGE